ETFWGSLFGRWKEIERHNTARALEALERFGLAHMASEYAGSLSGGQRKLLEMARALLVDPELVMLDEPTAGVNPALTQSLLGHITALRDEGLTVVFIEHDMDVVQEISDWVVCMSQGAVISEGPPGVVARDPAVIDAYLGSHHGEEGT
ncbi:MAG TPA: ATP-binding cassette domain-containing protein, partial [Acidimicrobiia bacterium]|nr:ATP-binding cassette domain-containing protein [Acidimicrobiia bacterium]